MSSIMMSKAVAVRATTARASSFNGSKCVVRASAPGAKASLRVRCEATEPKVSPAEPVVTPAEPVVTPAEPAVTPAEPMVSAAADADSKAAQFDPLDGTVQYGAPLGDTDILSNVMSIFKGGNASEILNGRAAMVGFTAALLVELSKQESLFNQMWNVRDVGIRTLLLPKLGFFLIPVTVIGVLAASFAPSLRGKKENGLNVPAEPYGPFTPSAETINGRAAMIGLVALLAVESSTGSALF